MFNTYLLKLSPCADSMRDKPGKKQVLPPPRAIISTLIQKQPIKARRSILVLPVILVYALLNMLTASAVAMLRACAFVECSADGEELSHSREEGGDCEQHIHKHD